MYDAEIICSWLQRIISFEIDNDTIKRSYQRKCEVVIGNLPPYPFLLDKNYNLITRTLTCSIPRKYYDWIYPTKIEKKAAFTYRIYHSLKSNNHR